MKNQYAVKSWKPLKGPKELSPEVLAPTEWKVSRLVNCTCDLFGDYVWEEKTQLVFALMESCRRHKFQVQTTYPKRMARVLSRLTDGKPLPPNIWLGVIVDNQDQAEERLPILLSIPAETCYVNCRMGETIDLRKWLPDTGSGRPIDIAYCYDPDPKGGFNDKEWNDAWVAQLREGGLIKDKRDNSRPA